MLINAYIGESEKSQRAERKSWRKGNVGSAVKQHAETSSHDLHPNYASVLETGVKTNDTESLFLLPLHSFMDKNSVNGRAPFPRV